MFSVIFALVAVSCSGGDGETAVPLDATAATQVDANDASAANDANPATDVGGSTNPTCGLLSVAEIESAIGRVVIGTEEMGGEPTDIFGACSWKFEPLTEGIFEGESPELLIQVQAGSEFYDQLLGAYPDTEVAGIGDGAFSRAEGELISVSNGNSVQVGTLLAYDVEQMQQAATAAEELSRLLADRV